MRNTDCHINAQNLWDAVLAGRDISNQVGAWQPTWNKPLENARARQSSA